MSNYSYLIHRAVKFAKPSRVMLHLLDRDLADAGVWIPQSASAPNDAGARTTIKRVMQDVLRVA
jgi:hypothetical protein